MLNIDFNQRAAVKKRYQISHQQFWEIQNKLHKYSNSLDDLSFDSLIKKIKQEPTLKYVSSETLNNIITKYWNESISFSDFCDMYLNNDYDSDYDEDDDLKDTDNADTVIKYRASKSKLCCFSIFVCVICFIRCI